MATSRPLIEVIDDAPLECGEGPMWDAVEERLLWTDALEQAVYVRDRATGQTSVLTRDLQVGSIVLHRDGPLVLATGGGLRSWHGPGDVRDAAMSAQGRAMDHLNDAIADPAGRVFTGQEVYSDDEPYEPGVLFRVDLDGTAQVVEEGLSIANGMGFSPDHTTFYLVDSPIRTIYAYDYDVESGAISKRRTLVTLGAEDGLPDGLTVDEVGFIWVARWFGGGISRFDPDGHLERHIELPVMQPSSLMFGGPDLDELFVTSAGVDWQSPLAPPGHDYTRPRGGPSFRIRPDVRGLPEQRAAIALPPSS
jgi:sugar lactone lactonase YvrE